MCQKGQSTIEYAIIATLVILGIITMGPYVLRSVNSHFKLWEQSTQDAVDDHLVDPGNIPGVDPTCTCSWVGGACGISGCKPNERLMGKTCTPSGCDSGYTCQTDDTCCSIPSRHECYGPSNPVTNPANPGGYDATLYHLPCVPGDRIFQFDCGPNVGQQVCQADHTTADGDRDCTAVCDLSTLPKDNAGSPIAQPCPGAGNRLWSDTGITLKKVCPLDSSGTCNYECIPGYILEGSTCVKPCDPDELFLDINGSGTTQCNKCCYTNRCGTNSCAACGGSCHFNLGAGTFTVPRTGYYWVIGKASAQPSYNYFTPVPTIHGDRPENSGEIFRWIGDASNNSAPVCNKYISAAQIKAWSGTNYQGQQQHGGLQGGLCNGHNFLNSGEQTYGYVLMPLTAGVTYSYDLLYSNRDNYCDSKHPPLTYGASISLQVRAACDVTQPPVFCGDGQCNSYENCGNCAQDCGGCPLPTCSASDDCSANGCKCPTGTTCSPITQKCFTPCTTAGMCDSGDGTGTCIDCPVYSNPGGGGSSTPYLFSAVGEKYYIENDVMETVRDQHYEVAKHAYEHAAGDPFKSRPTDYYKLRLKPDVRAKGIKFQIRELEPEESHIDQVRLVRVIHPKGAYVFADQETNDIKAVKEEQPFAPVKCTLHKTDCVKAIAKLDDLHVEADRDDSMTLEFDLKGRNLKNLYLTLNAWEKPLVKPETAPFKAKALSLMPMMLIDPDHPEKTVRLKDLHPRAIATRLEIALGDALKDFKGKKLVIRLLWTAHHYVDYVGLIESTPADIKKEELSLKRAVDAKGNDVLWRLLRKDKVYVHLVRGHQVDLLFARPRKALKNNEAETYFFVTSGYYHGLRTYKYPKVDPSEESFKKELKSYIDELNSFLKSKKK